MSRVNKCSVYKVVLPRQSKLFNTLLETCDDSKFKAPELCSEANANENNSTEAPDLAYVAFDRLRKQVVGVITFKNIHNAVGKVDGLWLSFATTMAHYNPKEYRGIGSRIFMRAKREAQKRKLNFIYLQAADDTGVGFYVKMGFLFLANTGAMLLPLGPMRDIPNRIRLCELELNGGKKFRRGHDKRWLRMLTEHIPTQYDNAYSRMSNADNTIVFTKQDVNKVILYPQQ